MEAEQDRRDFRATTIEVAGLAGLGALVAGLVLLRDSDLGVDPAQAAGAILRWMPATLPIAFITLLATALELAAGAAIARFVRRRPFERLDELLLEAFVATVAKAVFALGVLGGVGLFDQPILALVDGVLVGLGLARLRPWLAPGAMPAAPRLSAFGVLVAVAWLPPILLQLASPVVPFLDILPNHVAPAEHLRTFGALGQLTETQSPIYGPSRIFLGYTALLGTVTTLAGLPAGAALAGFILPSTVLVAVAVHRLAAALGGAGVGRWALLLFALTTSFARLSDARATVIVLPLVLWALATLADRLRRPAADLDAATPGPGLPEGVAVGLALGGAILVHPVIGFLAALSVGILVVVAPGRLGALGIPALGTAAVLASPQALTMLGVALPTLTLAMVLALAIALGIALDRAPEVHGPLVLAARALVAALGVGAVLGAGPVIRAFVAGAGPLVSVMELSLVGVVLAAVLRAEAARSPVAWAALAAGFLVATATQLVPTGAEAGLLGDALRFELPKTLHYWVPVFVAVLAAAGLEALLRQRAIPEVVRGVAVVAFVAAAALPLRTTPIDAFHLGEHRLSETWSIDLRWAATGFWAGFPDSRLVVDPPRQELLDEVRRLIEGQEIGPTTPILHIADSFQQWRATPLGVFDGVTESVVAPDAVVSIHTVGGRLHPLEEAGALLAGRTFPYVLLEPNPDVLPASLRDQILAAGYHSIVATDQGELFARGG